MKIKRINLREISEILSEKELKNVLGGCDGGFCISPFVPYACKCVTGNYFTVCVNSSQATIERAVQAAEDICWAQGKGQEAICV